MNDLTRGYVAKSVTPHALAKSNPSIVLFVRKDLIPFELHHNLTVPFRPAESAESAGPLRGSWAEITASTGRPCNPKVAQPFSRE